MSEFVVDATAAAGRRLLWRDGDCEVELYDGPAEQRGRCERALLAAGLPLPLQHRTEWAQTYPASTQSFVAVRDASARYQAGFAVELRPSRALPGHSLLRVQKFGAALSGGAREAGLRALAHLARSSQRVLRLYLGVYARELGVHEQVAALAGELGFRLATEERTYRETLLVDLAPDEDGILASFHRSTRRNIRQSAQQALEVRPITDPCLAGRIAALLEESLARTGGRPAHDDWAAAILLSARCPTLSRLTGLFRAEAHGPEALVAFAWAHNHGDYVDNPATGMVRVPGSRTPFTYALIWDVIRWAKQVGARWFDFGGVTLGHRAEDPLGGISDFKRGFSRAVVTVGEEWILEPHPLRGRLSGAISSVSSLATRLLSRRAG